MNPAFEPSHESIKQLEPYPAGKPLETFKREYGIDHVIKMASNENPLGCSPKVALAIQQELDHLSRYPDANGYDLKQAIAAYNNVSDDRITLGNGSEEIINLIARCFVNSTHSVVFGQYSFIAYPMVTASQGAKAIEVPAKEYGIDLHAMQKAVCADASVRVVFIANPNNPTGTKLEQNAIADFIRSIPSHVLVVLDEAYVDYEPSCNNQALIDEFEQLIILRTFSKAYGLAALRVGYAITHPAVADVFNRVRQPFNVNRLAQSAAHAALADQEFIQNVKHTNEQERNVFYQAFNELNVNYIPSYTNFILVEVGDAEHINQALLHQGIIIRPMDEYGLARWIRISIGTPSENQRLIQALTSLLSNN